MFSGKALAFLSWDFLGCWDFDDEGEMNALRNVRLETRFAQAVRLTLGLPLCGFQFLLGLSPSSLAGAVS